MKRDFCALCVVEQDYTSKSIIIRTSPINIHDARRKDKLYHVSDSGTSVGDMFTSIKGGFDIEHKGKKAAH